MNEIEIEEKLQAMIRQALVEYAEGLTSDDDSFIDNDELTSNEEDKGHQSDGK